MSFIFNIHKNTTFATNQYYYTVHAISNSPVYVEWEWLLLNANSAIYQLYHDKNKLIFNEIMMRSALY
jgi:hypothetical protein